MNEPRFAWRKRQAFAEAAEAIGVPTDQIMAASSDLTTVMWSDGVELDSTVYQGALERDANGVLILKGYGNRGTVRDWLPPLPTD